MNATSSAAATRDFWKTGLFLFVAVVLLAAPQAALLPLLDRDEPRFAEASREMVQSGDLIIPTFNHEPRYNKPPLIYWCQAISFNLFGQNAFAARLPSLIATAGTAFVIFAWGTQLGFMQIGLGAALSYAFCLQVIQQGRVATADALLIFFMTLTAYTGWRLLGHRSPTEYAPPRSVFRTGSALRAWTVRLVLALAAGFLAKGPEAWLPLVPLLILARLWRGQIYYLFCLLLSLLLVAVWGVPALIASHGDYWAKGMSEGVFTRMTSGLQGHGASSAGWYLLSIPLYLLLFWLSALPWSPLLLIHRKKLFAGWKPDQTEWYLLLNAAVIFLVFSFMVTKLPHYTLPAFPFIALLFAKRWIAANLRPSLPLHLSGGMGLAVAVLTLVLVPIALSNHLTPSPVGMLVLGANKAGALSPDTQFAYVDFQEPNVIWEMRRVVKGYGQSIPESEVTSFLNQPGPRAVVLSSQLWRKMGSASSTWTTYEARGLNAAKLSFIDLTLVVKK